MPPDIQRKILQDELHSVNESLQVYEQQGKEVSGRMRSGLETRRKNLTAKIADINFKLGKRKDNVPDLREMGVGHIICDESHNFKNLQFHTRNDRVAGIGNPQGSQRALDMLYAIRTLQDDRDMDIQATFMSGTTISNSLVEKYLLFKYYRPREMERQNIRCFDAWAATYCRKSSEFEIGVTGQVVLKERYRYFVKVPELANFYRAITDYRTGKDIGLDEPDIGTQDDLQLLVTATTTSPVPIDISASTTLGYRLRNYFTTSSWTTGNYQRPTMLTIPEGSKSASLVVSSYTGYCIGYSGANKKLLRPGYEIEDGTISFLYYSLYPSPSEA